MTVSCDAVREELPALATHSVDDSLRYKVETHVRSCARCRGELDDMREVVELLQEQQLPEPSADFEARVVSAVQSAAAVAAAVRPDSAATPVRSLAVPHRSRRRVYVPPALAAGLASVVVLSAAYLTTVVGVPEGGESREGGPLLASAQAPNPIQVVVLDVESAVDTIAETVTSLGGRPVRRLYDGATEVVVQLPESQMPALLAQLNQLGDVDRRDAGYRDGDGHVVLHLRER